MAALILIYALMLIFDAAVLGGFCYLIVAHQWSSWWMALVILVCSGANPRHFIEAIRLKGAQQ